MPCKALILDLDNTLVHSTHAYAVATAAALAAAGLHDEEAALQAARTDVKARFPAGHVSSRNRWLYFKRLLELKGCYAGSYLVHVMTVYENSLAEDITRQWRELKRSELIQKLAAKAPLAVLTNENLRGQILKLNAMDGADAFFKVVRASEECGVEKPHPALLRSVFDHFRIDPEDAVVVGDSFTDDIKPAIAAGCRAFLSTEFGGPAPAPSPQFQTIASLEELLRHAF